MDDEQGKFSKAIGEIATSLGDGLGKQAGIRLHARIEFKKSDVFIGALVGSGSKFKRGTIWLYVVPMFPLRVDWNLRVDEIEGRKRSNPAS